MSFLYKDTVSAADYQALRSAVGWSALPLEQAASGLRHSAKVVGCYDGAQIVGSARVLWDGGYIAYVADVMVMPAYQHQGVGTEMMERLLAFISKQLQPGWTIKIVLVAAKGREPYYERFGFRARPHETGGAGMEKKLFLPPL